MHSAYPTPTTVPDTPLPTRLCCWLQHALVFARQSYVMLPNIELPTDFPGAPHPTPSCLMPSFFLPTTRHQITSPLRFNPPPRLPSRGPSRSPPTINSGNPFAFTQPESSSLSSPSAILPCFMHRRVGPLSPRSSRRCCGRVRLHIRTR